MAYAETEFMDLRDTLVDLATYRHGDRTANNKPDPIVIHVAYAQDNLIYHGGRIIAVDPIRYMEAKTTMPNELVNKFGQTYENGTPLLLHKKLADVLIDTAIDLRDYYHQFTVVMDGLRTCDSGRLMEKNRPDLVEAKLLAPSGTSAHNRALAVDSKLFELIRPLDPLPANVTLAMLKEVDEKGHLDDLNMTTSNRFYKIDPSEASHRNRLQRLQAWQRASVKNRLPIANLLAEFWDDRVTGSPADMWRVLTCRAMCLGLDGNPQSNTVLGILRLNLQTLHEQHQQGVINASVFAESAHSATMMAWDQLFTAEQQQQLEELLGQGGGEPPELEDFIFHEWIQNIYDHDLIGAGFKAQSLQSVVKIPDKGIYIQPGNNRVLH